jgi:hypothetical protein
MTKAEPFALAKESVKRGFREDVFHCSRVVDVLRSDTQLLGSLRVLSRGLGFARGDMYQVSGLLIFRYLRPITDENENGLHRGS